MESVDIFRRLMDFRHRKVAHAPAAGIVSVGPGDEIPSPFFFLDLCLLRRNKLVFWPLCAAHLLYLYLDDYRAAT